MHTTVTCPPAAITISQSRLGEDVSTALAAIYRRAADLIREHGRDSRPEGSRWELTGPHSISASELLDAHSAVRDRLASMVRRMAQAIWRPNGRDARLDRILAELNGIREGGR